MTKMWNHRKSFIQFWICLVVVNLFVSCVQTVVGKDVTGSKIKSKRPYFKFCNEDKDGYTVEGVKCPHGTWFPKPLKPHKGCVCINGIWAISHGMCDDDYSIAYGEGHCFAVDRDIERLSFLGSTEAINYIVTDNTHVFQQFSNKIEFDSPTANNHTILLIRPKETSCLEIGFQPRDAQQLDEDGFGNSIEEFSQDSNTLCIDNGNDKQYTHLNKRILIYKTKSSIKSVTSIDECPDEIKKDRKIFSELEMKSIVYLGEIVHVKSGGIFKKIERCQQSCHQIPDFTYSAEYLDSNEKKNTVRLRSKRATDDEIRIDLKDPPPSLQGKSSGIKRPTTYDDDDDDDEGGGFNVIKPQTAPKESNSPSSPSSPSIENEDSTNTELRNRKNKANVEERTDGAFEPLNLDRGLSPLERDHAINVANLRVAKQELNWLLEGIRPPTLNSDNWKLVRKLKEIFSMACPKTVTPKILVNGMMRIFRLLYINTRDYYPNGYMMEEKAQAARLQTTLDSCLKDTTEIEFKYVKIKRQHRQSTCRIELEEVELENGTWAEKNVSYCDCENKMKSVNFTYDRTNGTLENFELSVDDSLTIATDLTFMMSGENPLGIYHDFPTETVWKIITFGHYYCAKYFSDTPADHSAMMTRLEDFFNEDILYRWTRPGFNSNKVWQYLYSAFDFKKFAESVDACVAAAKWVSQYPEWVNRPTLDINRRRKRRSLQGSIIKNRDFSAHCLQNPWDPVGISNARRNCA